MKKKIKLHANMVDKIHAQINTDEKNNSYWSIGRDIVAFVTVTLFFFSIANFIGIISNSFVNNTVCRWITPRFTTTTIETQNFSGRK